MANHNPPTNGFDKRRHQINRKGRPKTFDAFRELGQMIAHETATDKAGEPVIARDGHKLTVAEAILRQWASSKDARLQMAFVEVAYGKVPQPVQHTGGDGGPITVHVVYDGAVSNDA